MSDGPAPNRVTPWGEVVAAPGRGRWMGNRGCLHPRSGTRQIVRVQTTARWITCTPSFRGRRVPQWQPGRYTPLFFLDESVALAAGHRPCAECRHADYLRWRAAWVAAHGGPVPRADQMDAVLATQRLPTGAGRAAHALPWVDVPTGAVVVRDGVACTVAGGTLLPWRRDNSYGPAVPRPSAGLADVLTPAATVAVLRAGYAVQLGGDGAASPAALVTG